MKMTIFWRNKERKYAVEELNFKLGDTNFCVTSSPQTILPGKTILEELAINDDTANDKERVRDLIFSDLDSMEVTDTETDQVLNFNAVECIMVDINLERYIFDKMFLAKYKLVPFGTGLISLQTYNRYADIIRKNDRIEYAQNILNNMDEEEVSNNVREYILSKKMNDFAETIDNLTMASGEEEHAAVETYIADFLGGLCSVDLVSNKGTEDEIRQTCRIPAVQYDFIQNELKKVPADREAYILYDENGDNCDLAFVDEVILI